MYIERQIYCDTEDYDFCAYKYYEYLVNNAQFLTENVVKLLMKIKIASPRKQELIGMGYVYLAGEENLR